MPWRGAFAFVLACLRVLSRKARAPVYLCFSRHSRSGQTTVEWLMLMALTFLTGYLMATGPIASFTRLMVATIRSSIVNVVQNAELRPGEQLEPGEGGHPSDPNRGRPVHL